jgi:hypothetical protein
MLVPLVVTTLFFFLAAETIQTQCSVFVGETSISRGEAIKSGFWIACSLVR